MVAMKATDNLKDVFESEHLQFVNTLGSGPKWTSHFCWGKNQSCTTLATISDVKVILVQILVLNTLTLITSEFPSIDSLRPLVCWKQFEIN